MKILMITEKDAANASLSRIANELNKKGHIVKIFAPYYDTALLRGFMPTIERSPIADITDDIYEWCDIVITSVVAVGFLQEKLLRLHKPIFTHNYLTDGQVNWGGDICFVPSIETTQTDFDNKISYTHFAIGEPKYDSVDNEKEIGESRRFLFIDSGHFPFGKKGKIELAKTLLSICEANPEYELVVKPRFLPGDTVITHRNLLTLYDVLCEETNGNFPKNLIYLDKHYDLMELIEQSDVVLCLYTTAFAGAYVADKRLVILEGFDSEDVYDVRNKTFMRVRNSMRYVDSFVHYSKVNDYLPEGIEADPDKLRFLFAERENVASKICEVIEYMYDNYYSKGCFPKMKNYQYNDYKSEIEEDIDDDWDAVIDRRLRNKVLRQMLIHTDYHVKESIDTTIIEEYVDGLDFLKQDLASALRSIPAVRSKCVVENREILLKDYIDAGVLLNAYYLLKDYDNILTFPRTDISAYYLFSGFAYRDLEDEKNALINLEKYFEMTADRNYIKEISDMSGNRFNAFKTIIMLYEKLGMPDRIREYVELMIEYYKVNYLVSDINDEPKTNGQRAQLEFIKKYRGKES